MNFHGGNSVSVMKRDIEMEPVEMVKQKKTVSKQSKTKKKTEPFWQRSKAFFGRMRNKWKTFQNEHNELASGIVAVGVIGSLTLLMGAAMVPMYGAIPVLYSGAMALGLTALVLPLAHNDDNKYKKENVTWTNMRGQAVKSSKYTMQLLQDKEKQLTTLLSAEKTTERLKRKFNKAIEDGKALVGSAVVKGGIYKFPTKKEHVDVYRLRQQ